MPRNRTRPGRLAALVVISAAALCGVRAQESESAPYRVASGSVLSETYHVDRIYKSMMGPDSTMPFRLPATAEPELLWLVGYRATVVDAETRGTVSQEFMCHSNLNLDPYEQDLKRPPGISRRLFTLSQGQQEIVLPDYFGIPVMSRQRLLLTTQVLNLNLPQADLDLKHQVEVMLVRDRELTRPMKALFQREVQLMKSLADQGRYYGLPAGEADPEQHGESCAVGQHAPGSPALYTDSLGQEFSAHWVVEPGRELSRGNVTRWMNLSQDTTVHYIAVHLHPFAESLELIDLTAGKSLYKAEAKNVEGRIGLAQVDFFSSDEGIRVYKDHEYELVSVYDNTSREPQDAMAVMFLYMLDREFERPAP